MGNNRGKDFFGWPITCTRKMGVSTKIHLEFVCEASSNGMK